MYNHLKIRIVVFSYLRMSPLLFTEGAGPLPSESAIFLQSPRVDKPNTDSSEGFFFRFWPPLSKGELRGTSLIVITTMGKHQILHTGPLNPSPWPIIVPQRSTARICLVYVFTETLHQYLGKYYLKRNSSNLQNCNFSLNCYQSFEGPKMVFRTALLYGEVHW